MLTFVPACSQDVAFKQKQKQEEAERKAAAAKLLGKKK